MISDAQPAFTWHANKRHYLRDGETRKLSGRARRAALVEVGLRIAKGYRTGGRPLLFRRKTVVRRECCDLQRAEFTNVAYERAPLRWLSLGRWRNMRANRARAPGRASHDRSMYCERVLHRRKTSLLRNKTVVRRASCDLQRAAGIHAARRTSATALTVSREAAKYASLPRARAGPR